MHVTEYFDNVVVLDSESPGNPLLRRLHLHGQTPREMNLAHHTSWRDSLIQALEQARQSGGPGILLLLTTQKNDEAFWRTQDAFVERLASSRWDIVYLGHGEASETPPDCDQRPGLIHCDMPPGHISAMAVSCDVLEFLLQNMPEHGSEGPLKSVDWLTIASWLAAAHVRPESVLAAWPPLMHLNHTTLH